MNSNLKYPPPPVARGKILTIILLIGVGVLMIALPVWTLKNPTTQANSLPESRESFSLEDLDNLATVEGNSLLPIADFAINSPESRPSQEIKVVVTAYSSTPWETDGNPFITAAGTQVREGIVANNLLAFGTKVRIPEIFGDKVFIVEDRMSWKKGNYHIDIWFPSYWEALNFGVQSTYIEVLEN